MTQKELVLDYMKQNGSITQLEATRNLGITRLAARIADLKKMGYQVLDETESSLNRWGSKTQYTRYRLAVR